MRATLREAFESELHAAEELRRAGDLDRAFHHLERAHILGQQHVAPHVRTHLAMLRIGVQRRDAREIIGQVLRVPAAALGSALGAPPGGNTGGANVGFFARREIPPDLKALLEQEGRWSRPQVSRSEPQASEDQKTHSEAQPSGGRSASD